MVNSNTRLQRIALECALCAVRFSQTKSASYDDEEGTWVIIHDFALPQGYNYDTTDLLLVLPPNYPLSPPDWFYVDNNLRLQNGKRLEHVFYDSLTHDPNRQRIEPPQRKGWTGCCLHFRSWKPTNDPLTGHSLLSVCELIKEALKRWSR